MGSDSGTHESFEHIPVLLAETVDILSSAPGGWVLDATLGGAGHAQRILEVAPHISVIGLDQDPIALTAASERLAPFGNRAQLHRSRFDHLDVVLKNQNIHELAGFLFDLGVSSPQLDRSERGFSFRNNGPLDMRMDPDAALTAADIVNEWSVKDLARLIKRHSDERFADRIARAIQASRPHSGTADLAEVVVNAIPAAARRTGGHPAKRTFQALRIEVNAELEILAPALNQALDQMTVGARGVVLTYHSGEDRIVKKVFRERSTSAGIPGLPTPEGAAAEFSLIRPISLRPGAAELEANPRARSARLRAIERIAATGPGPL